MALPWSNGFEGLLNRYSDVFHEPYFHFGEDYSMDEKELTADIKHWLDAGQPRPWDDSPDGSLV